MTKEERRELEFRVEQFTDLLQICTEQKLQFATDVYQVISTVIAADKEKLYPEKYPHKSAGTQTEATNQE